NEFKKVHNKVLDRYIKSSDKLGARATTDDEDLNKKTNIYKMQLKLICVLFEYLNNSSGCEKVSLDTIKIVDNEGDPVVIKGGDAENDKKVYLCPTCYNDMTAQVQAQKQKLEIEQKEPLYFWVDDVSIQLNPPISYPFLITRFDGTCYYGVALTFFKQFNNDDGTCSKSSSATAIISLNRLIEKL
ncbi:unnamed protein product, partial [Rotaria sordida]